MSVATRELHNFINGEFVPAADGATEPVINPATGSEYARAASSGRPCAR